MAQNKNKTDFLHSQLPTHLNSKTNANWSALIGAFGERDQEVSDLIEEVRKQFFIKTSSRPYLDRLAANNKISRPRFVGMDDESFKQYIPVLSYQPKQVKLIIDKLLDVFFFKESTTAFITSQNGAPFLFEDSWELSLIVDEEHLERIQLNESDFTDISNATIDETIAAINRQAKRFYATSYYDSASKKSYIRIFTNTVGSKGSLRILGGRLNTALKFNGFIENAGQGSDTEWIATKIGDEVTLQYVSGTSPGLEYVQADDIVIINLSGIEGSFSIQEIDLYNNSIKFKNLLAVAGSYTQSSDNQVKFIRPNKYVAYLNPRRAISWETSPGEIIIEMPTSPPVVKRSLKGSSHINGAFSEMINKNSDTSLTVKDAYLFPESGKFFMQKVDEIVTKIETISLSETVSYKNESRLQFPIDVYSYSDRTILDTIGDIDTGNYTITNLASTIGLEIGQQVSMVGLPPYTKIVGIDGNVVYVSHPAESSSSAIAVRFLGNVLNGISPSLPSLASENEYTLTYLSRTSNVISCITATNHNYAIGDNVIITACSGIPVTITADFTDGSNIVTNVSDMSYVAVGMHIYNSALPSGAYITSIGSNSFTLDTNVDFSYVSFSLDETPLIDDMIDFDTLYFSTLNLNTEVLFEVNGTYEIIEVGLNTFSFYLNGIDGVAEEPGISRVEKLGLSNSGSKIIVSSSINEEHSRIKGPYIWNTTAPYVLSANKAQIFSGIQGGKIVKLITTSNNDMPKDGGYVIFDYGLETEEGPVRYLYKPTDTTLAIDPSYTFKYNHNYGSYITQISKKGPHAISSNGAEYAPYITNPSEARFILEDLIRSIKSAGIFINFLVRYPEQLYATIDVYESGKDPG